MSDPIDAVAVAKLVMGWPDIAIPHAGVIFDPEHEVGDYSRAALAVLNTKGS